MKCAYCGKESKSTREHIISSGVLDIFPECFLTIDEKRKVIHMADPVVRDVCTECNNHKLSYIDSYAKQFIQQYFIQKYEPDDTIDLKYNYTLLQKMLLKYAFNDLRAQRDDITFFDREIINFLLNEEDTIPKSEVTILAGIAVNTSPVPDYMFGNLKLRWRKSPTLLSNSIVKHINYETGQIFLRDQMEIENFKGLTLSYIFRFHSGQFILLCWDKESPNVDENLAVIKLQYPYTMLDENSNSTSISRCTNETTYNLFHIVEVNWGHGIMDEITTMRRLASEHHNSTLDELNKLWQQEERRLADEHKRK
jgi:hypothetical protein